jgi:hypothetical protein
MCVRSEQRPTKPKLSKRQKQNEVVTPPMTYVSEPQAVGTEAGRGGMERRSSQLAVRSSQLGYLTLYPYP